MELVNPAAQLYAERHSSAEGDLLKELAAYTEAHHPKAHMLSGHLQGKLLEMISCMMRPRRILEVGTFTGYSALCLATGLAADGILHTIEMRKDDAAIAQGFFDRSFNREKIKLHVGEAAKIIDDLAETWDLVFLDADKTGYVDYFNRIFPKLRQNGFILADNVLFHGQVLEDKIHGKNALAIDAFNKMVAQRTDVEKVLLPVRDGICVIRKL